jgi:hypothetical protein
MQLVHVKKAELEDKIKELSRGIQEPLYRGLHSECNIEYLNEGMMYPKQGDLSTGTGIFFTNDPTYGISFANGIITIADLARFRKMSRVIDTRNPEYVTEIKERTTKHLGREPNGYEIWIELVGNFDTITNIREGDHDNFIYTRRVPVSKSELEYDIRIID